MKKYYSSSNSVSHIAYHLVFCPRYRRQLFTNSDICAAFTKSTQAIAIDLDLPLFEVKFGKDFVHLYVHALPKHSPHELVGRIKNVTSKQLREDFEQLEHLDTLWTRNYFVSTDEIVPPETVIAFVESQKMRG